MKLTKELIQKFDIETPRYTSYPTIPIWKSSSESEYKNRLSKFKKKPSGLSLYIHVPFCQKRCFYCTCNVVIRKSNIEIGNHYITYLEKEMALITRNLNKMPIIKQLHIGGGTPTFLSDSQLSTLCQMIDQHFDTSTMEEQSIELDPRSVDTTRIQALHELKFNRLSFGIQDFNEQVQKAVDRQHSFEDIKILFEKARSLGFLSINTDLIYGLPLQTTKSFKQTINQIISLKPDRIAIYSFAYIPKMHQHQRLLNEKDLPNADQKIRLFLQARQQLLQEGYESIAMDHFALKTDPLAIAYQNGTLRRNFMGYTTLPTDNYLGLGVSAIGYISNFFTQNAKNLKNYCAQLDNSILPIEKGLQLSRNDLIRQWVITSLMCQFKVNKKVFYNQFQVDFDAYFKSEFEGLIQREKEGLVRLGEDQIDVTELGRLFVRNVCREFDAYLD